jgi:tetratricopeptide (TPR) repeat protein
MDIASLSAAEARTHLMTRASDAKQWVSAWSVRNGGRAASGNVHEVEPLALGNDPLDSAVRNAARLRGQGRYPEAVAILRAWFEDGTRELTQSEQGAVFSGLAVTFHESGQLEAALEHYMQAIDRYQRAGSQEHAEVLFRLYNNLAMVCRMLGRLDEAELAYITAVEFHDSHIGATDPASLAAVYGNLAFLYHDTGLGSAACDMQKLAVELLKQHAPEDKLERVQGLRRAGIFAAGAGSHADAVRSFEAARALLGTVAKAAESLQVELLICEGTSSLALGLGEDALALYERASTALQRRAHPDELLLALLENNIGCILLRMERTEQALTAFSNAHDLLRSHPASDLVARAEVLHNLALAYEILGSQQAAQQFRESARAVLHSVSEEVRLMIEDCEALGQAVLSSQIQRRVGLNEKAYARLPMPPPSLRKVHPTGQLVIPLRSETTPAEWTARSLR